MSGFSKQSDAVFRGKAVIFDLFGTLVGPYSKSRNERFLDDFSRLVGVARSDLVGVWGSMESGALTGRYKSVDENMHEIFRLLQVEADPDLIQSARNLRLETIREFMKPNPTALSVLSHLRKEGFSLGLISGCGPDVPELWPESPLRSFFSDPVFSCVAGVPKPDRRLFERCCRGLGVETHECLYVADGSGGELTAARHAGMTAVLLRTPLDDVYDPVRQDVQSWQGPVIDDLSELKELFRRGSRCHFL